MSYDSVVVGGGVMGSAIALRLAQAGQKVLVLEKAIPGAEASGAAGGILGAQIEGEADGPLFRLCLASRRAFEGLAAELAHSTGIDIGFRRCGVMKVALAEGDLDALVEKMAWQQRLDLPVVELSGDEARKLEPGLGPNVCRALHFPEEPQVDPRRLVQALPLAAQKAGAEFRTGLVQGIVTAGDRVVGVRFSGERIDTGSVIVAAGAWTTSVEGIGLSKDAVVPVRGQMVKLRPSVPMLDRIVFSPKGYVVPRKDGTLLAGSTMERVGFEKKVTAAGVAGILRNVLETFPSLADAEIVETWSGLRPAPADGLPLIGKGAARGLFIASGHHRNGILLTPETARLVAEAVIAGEEPESLRPFSPTRFLA